MSRPVEPEVVRVRRNPDVTARELRDAEGALLLHRVSGAYHRLNRTGALIWRALERPATLVELERRVRDELAGAPATLAADLLAYVEDLAGRDLVRLGGGAGEA